MKKLPIGDEAPKTFDEACEIIKQNIEPDDIAFLKENGATSVHFSFGMWMRNNWGLWKKDSPLGNYFRGLGLGHADDMSGCILDFLDEYVNGREYDLNKSIKKYRDYWMKRKVDPLTQEELV